MTQTAWLLSLAQFYLGLGFVLLFLALELGLAWLLLLLRVRARHSAGALLAYRFWVRVFALAMMLGFAAALPLVFQLGTLWPGFMERAGEVAGPLVGMAILSAFIFRSCFLGAMLYGQRSLSERAHILVNAMVALGSSLVAWWLVALLAWLLRPDGTFFQEGRYVVSSWQALLSGYAPLLFAALLAGGVLLAALLMVAVSAWRARLRPSDAGDRKVFVLGLALGLAALLAQIAVAWVLVPDLLQAQPARLAATVLQWTSGAPQPAPLLALANEATGTTSWQALALAGWPGLIGLDGAQTLVGLHDLAGIRPPVLASFYTFRLALLLAGLLLIQLVWALWRARRLRFEPDYLSRAQRLGMRALLWLALILQISAWSWLLLGNLPYAVYGGVQLRELAGPPDQAGLGFVFALQLAVYAALLLGFRQLLLHTARYGVVPVARHRGRA